MYTFSFIVGNIISESVQCILLVALAREKLKLPDLALASCSSGSRVWGFRGLEFKSLGVQSLGFRVWGLNGLGFRV